MSCIRVHAAVDWLRNHSPDVVPGTTIFCHVAVAAAIAAAAAVAAAAAAAAAVSAFGSCFVLFHLEIRK